MSVLRLRRHLGILGDTGLAVGVVGLLFASAGTKTVSAENAPTPSPAATPAALEISITPSRQTVARREPIEVFIVVTNSSATEVRGLKVSLSNGDFSAVTLPSFPEQLAAFNSTQGTASIEAQPSAQFKQQQVLFTFWYSWSNQGQLVTSIQASAISIEVTRPFDEEAKGLLGGGAALLYLLLPVIPLALGYQLVDRWLSGTFQFPTFGTDYVVPAFLVGVLLNLVLLIAFRQFSVDYAEPVTMLVILVGSFLIGSGFAAVRRWQDLRLLAFWRYDREDEPPAYLKKVLLRPNATAFYEAAKGTDSDGATWSGVLLQQPAAGPALGATLQVFKPAAGPNNQVVASTKEVEAVFTDQGRLRPGREPRRKLVELLEANKLSTRNAAPILQDNIQRPEIRVQIDLKGFKESAARVPVQLVVYTS